MNDSFSDSRKQMLPDVRAALRERLLSLPFGAFLRCVADLLEKSGYADVHLSSRKDWRGRNGKDGSGGFDLTARLTVGGVARRILVQAKQFDDSQRVFLSQVDALRGVCLRTGATEGLLLTTGPVSARIPRQLLAAASFAPIRVIDGEELLDLLITHRLGVWQEADEEGGYGVDDDYFQALQAAPDGNSRADCVPAKDAAISPSTSEFIVRVAVTPITGRRAHRTCAL
jgi:restriction endonuclease Mrr